jgi:hypothetical protein
VLPNFLVIGSPKSGTSSLYAYLRSHPDAFMPARKELNFFIAERPESRRGLDWYERQFCDGDDAVAVGEASPLYSVHPVHSGVPGRIATLMPRVKLVYVVRHPVHRMISHYLHMYRGSDELRPVERALRENIIYVNASRYAYQIEQYLDYFSQDQLLVILSEELRNDRDRTLETVYRFLGLDPTWRPPNLDVEFNRSLDRVTPRTATKTLMKAPGWKRIVRLAPHRTKQRLRSVSHRPMGEPPKLPPALEDELLAVFREDVERLRTYVRGEFDGWGLK